jgi:3-dehydroquinate synthase
MIVYSCLRFGLAIWFMVASALPAVTAQPDSYSTYAELCIIFPARRQIAVCLEDAVAYSITTDKAEKISTLQPARPQFDRPVFVGDGWFDEIVRMVAEFARQRMVAIVVDDEVARLFPQQLEQLQAGIERSCVITLQGGESSKTLDVFAQLQEFMAGQHMHRDDMVLSFCGGTLGDVVGFCAATYAHGITWINIPTSLTAQVDCAFGGYTALNIGDLKNYSGAFYWPSVVFVDLAFVTGLPERELRTALAEMARLSMLADEPLYRELCAACGPGVGVAGLKSNLKHFVIQTIKAKSGATMEDPFLHNHRVALRIGRTTSQALETASHLRLNHGDAVAIGLAFEAFMAQRMGLLSETDRRDLVNLLENCGLPTALPAELHDREIIDAMRMEKHNVGAEISIVLPYAPGQMLPDWPKPHVLLHPDALYAHFTAYRLEKG